MCMFRANPCFLVFPCFHVLERKISLCSQIREIPFAFFAIKTRLFSPDWKVVTVSGAGRMCQRDTVPDRPGEIIFYFNEGEPGGQS